jgi:hypothetical protein
MRAGRWSVVVLVLLSSCAPRREGVMLDTQKTSASQLMTLARQADDRLHSLSGRGTISFESPEMSGSASFTLTVRKPDSLLVQLEGPFGIDAGLFFLSRERFVMYNSFQNTVYAGTPSPQSLRSLIPLDLSYDQIFAVFTGSIPLPTHAELTKYGTDDGLFLLRYTSTDRLATYWVDPDELLVRRFEMRNGDGEVVLEGTSSGVIDHDGLRIARRLSLTMPGEGRRISVAFSRADLNTDDLAFDYSIPASARKLIR